jgi:hypothetical protein
MPFSSRVFGLLAVACAATATAAADDETARPRVRVYTNADLERIHPLAGQTGGSSTPAATAEEDAAAERETASRGQGEAYWRREAAASGCALEERAAGLRADCGAGARHEPVVYGPAAVVDFPRIELDRVVARLARGRGCRIRRRRTTSDRARRDGALPGWLR